MFSLAEDMEKEYYGKFNIRFQGPMIWNSIDEDFKRSSLSLFKLKLKEHLTDNY